MLNLQGRQDEAIRLHLEAYDYSTRLHDQEGAEKDLVNLGAAYQRSGRFKEAQEAFKEVIRPQP